ncbi:MAG: gamma-glutamyltransferase [Flavobacteriaceae bacterium]|nr:gamma-glutamyltransferase [Flavobacteriaceae bacterium]MCY4215510.1 gamma-glutamyltransferase [Flavobacteriaceae bacterium]MCY4253270.1 gamma-glutamyltransferase [Flavobacteriaceae bacterium]
MINKILKSIVYGLLLCFITLHCNHHKPATAAVVSARKEASKIGIDIIKQGGNAFDAAVAVGFALTVCYPFAGNIAGGGFMVYRTHEGEIGSLDYREKAPLLAHRDMFLDSLGKSMPHLSRIGGLASGVPGSVAGMVEMHQKFGSLPWEVVLQPAIDLAQKGFRVTRKQASTLRRHRKIIIEVNGEHSLYSQKHKHRKRIKNPELAKTLEIIQKNGHDGFYKGEVAEKLIQKVQETGGIITQEDFDLYRAIWRDPIEFDYNDLTIYSMGPPSSGGICIGQILKMAEPHPLDQFGHNSLKSIQVLVEAQRRSFADRSHFLGDGDFVSIPMDSLLDDNYLSDRMRSMDFEKATKSEDILPGVLSERENFNTTHYSIIDPRGNAVAVTTTLNGAYGSKVYVEELGTFLNNEMDDFVSNPGEPNMFGMLGGQANAIEPQKRMLSSMTPTIVEKNGQLALIVGTPGGPTIITSVVQTILNVFEYEMSAQEAVEAPRFHHQWYPDVIVMEPDLFEPQLIDSLIEKQYNVSEEYTRIMGRVDAIKVDSLGTISTGADPRGDDYAAILR